MLNIYVLRIEKILYQKSRGAAEQEENEKAAQRKQSGLRQRSSAIAEQQDSKESAAGRRRGRADGLPPSFFTRYPPHDCLEVSGVVSGAYAADVSGLRLRGADRAGPREKLYGTRRSRLPPWESAFLLT